MDLKKLKKRKNYYKFYTTIIEYGLIFEKKINGQSCK